ncbi:hypothetical protein B0H14DRAFT_2902592 [Mycena olivaceomarginata]|nr:hypothetical protein B0H14DRAFT_2902592 [Mycena olivaceomarginata]
MNDPNILDDCLKVRSKHWSRLELRARNRVEAQSFIWILHWNEETISSFYSSLCSLPFITLPAPFFIYLHPYTTSFPFRLFSIFYIAYFFSGVFFSER